MECLDTEVLCMHLDNELDARMHAEVTEHLRTCQRCADGLRALTEHDAWLRSALPSPRTPEAHRRACYSAEELSAYASGLLTSQEETRCEQHLQTCDVCLGEVMALSSTLTLLRREPLSAPPADLVAAVQKSFGGVEQKSVVERLGAVVIQIAADGLKFVEALLMPEHVRLAIGGQRIPVGAFRSASGREAAVARLDIQQSGREFDLQLSVLQEDAGTVSLKVQLSKQGQPVVRKRVSLSAGGRMLSSSTTSAQGAVEFPRLAHGEYTVRVPQENVETQLVLRAAEGATPVR